MNAPIRFLAIPILALSLAACDKKESKSSDDVKTETTDSKKPASDSKVVAPKPTKPAKPAATEYVSEAHAFSVMAPRQPKITNPPAPGGIGKVTSYMFSRPSSPGATMLVVAEVPIAADASDEDRMKVLTDGRDGMLKQYGATITSDNAIKVGEHVGRDLSFKASHPQAGNMVGRAKMVVRGSALYQVLRISKPNAKSLIAEANALIDSFKFTN